MGDILQLGPNHEARVGWGPLGRGHLDLPTQDSTPTPHPSPLRLPLGALGLGLSVPIPEGRKAVLAVDHAPRVGEGRAWQTLGPEGTGGERVGHLGPGVWQREACLAASGEGSGARCPPRGLPRPGGCCLGPPMPVGGGGSSLHPKCLTHPC